MGFPYPGPGEAPCDFDEDWCQFTGALDTTMDRWEAGLNRAYPAVPAAKLLQTEAVTIIGDQPIPMSEVVLDTAGMTNLDADPYGITIVRSAIYTVWGTLIETDASGGAGAQSVLRVSFLESNTVLVLGAGEYRNVVYWPAVSLTEGTRLVLQSFLSGQNIRTGRLASLAVFWHSDVVRP
jgi:hypothetical protein